MSANQSALNPDQPVIVEACAGSGKTWLLVSRIVRLLLAGSDPSSILAITFTRKAAGEMRQRLYGWLEWCACASIDALTQFLREREVAEHDLADALARAPGLFEQVVTAHPGIRIQTFHAWFYELVQRAPLNSGYAGFRLNEQTGPLREQAWRRFIRHPENTACLTPLLQTLGHHGTRQALDAFLFARNNWLAWTEGHADPLDYAIDQFSQLGQLQTPDPLAALLAADDFLPLVSAYIQAMSDSTATRKIAAEQLSPVLAIDLPAEQRWELLCSSLLTQTGELSRTIKPNTKPAPLYDLHQQLGQRVLQVQQCLRDRQAAQLNIHLVRAGVRLLQTWQDLKRERQLLDFDDIEWLTHRLLSETATAGYLLMRLDARYRHLLLDEFQDTNPLQWRILQAWLHASGTDDTGPGLFVVGDPKQSIYRFRGAQSGLFATAAAQLEQHGARWLRHNQTRRLSQAVLHAVNRTLTDRMPHFAPHTGIAQAPLGQVIVLPLPALDEPVATTDAATPCRNPLTTPAPVDTRLNARTAEAQQLVILLQQMVGHWHIHDGETHRVLAYRDIMLLVQRRTHLAVYEQALRAAGIPFQRSSKGGLLDTQEVDDVICVLRALADSTDNLALAQALRCPIFACSDLDLQYIRKAQIDATTQRNADQSVHTSWLVTLLTMSIDNADCPSLARARQHLAHWQHAAQQLPIHDLLHRIMAEADVPNCYMATTAPALMPTVRANLAGLLDLALQWQGGRYPHLLAFLRDLRRLAKHQQDSPDEGDSHHTDSLTIRTIHGAKGLEAPVVWLLDSGTHKLQATHWQALTDWPADASRPRHFSLAGSKKLQASWQTAVLAQHAALDATEQRNLLYVAMTRAQHTLIVSAPPQDEPGGWHAEIASALGGDSTTGAALPES